MANWKPLFNGFRIAAGVWMLLLVFSSSSPVFSYSADDYFLSDDIQEYLDAMECQEFETAVVLSRVLFIRYPGNPRLAAFYGIALIRAGKIHEGEKVIQYASSNYPDLPEIRYGLGLVVITKNELVTAADHFAIANSSRYFLKDAILQQF